MSMVTRQEFRSPLGQDTRRAESGDSLEVRTTKQMLGVTPSQNARKSRSRVHRACSPEQGGAQSFR